MSQPTLDTFFGGGGKSFSWKDKPIGTTISGTITAVHPPQQQTDPADGSLQFKKNGEPKMSVRIDLATDERDPEDPEDDGLRGLYVQGWMQGAVGDALRKAGRNGAPEVGARLTVKLSERAPNDRPGLNPTNKFVAEYVPASSAATQTFFNNGSSGGVAVGNALNQAAGQPEPQRPNTIPEAAWNTMDDATKRSVAATLGSVDQPPF